MSPVGSFDLTAAIEIRLDAIGKQHAIRML
jgi:hypothetical protein